MSVEQRRFLEKRYDASKWRGRGGQGRRVLEGISLDRLEIRGWTLVRSQRAEHAETTAIRSLWRRGESTSELLAVDVFECASVKAAHTQLMDALGNMQSGAVERLTDKNAPGDVAFGLDDTMVLFARINVVVLVRNAGPTVVPVGAVARKIDALLERWPKSEKSR
ncbi:MAG TPA: hypothetical protein VEZ44_15755 [bacterium]|nr:hypothetical protein [bacterium]